MVGHPLLVEGSGAVPQVRMLARSGGCGGTWTQPFEGGGVGRGLFRTCC